jgi:hypothetical protein
MFSTLRGFRFTLNCNGQRDLLVVGFAGIETEEQAANVAFAAARNGYPTGTIDIVSIQSGSWCPTGLAANAEGTAVWCN